LDRGSAYISFCRMAEYKKAFNLFWPYNLDPPLRPPFKKVSSRPPFKRKIGQMFLLYLTFFRMAENKKAFNSFWEFLPFWTPKIILAPFKTSFYPRKNWARVPFIL
jgi:hypothetical protein